TRFSRDWSSDVCSSDLTGFDQGFEAGLDQLDATAAQNGLLTEQVGFGFVLEGGFDDAGTAAAHAGGIGQGDILGIAGSVLVDGEIGRASCRERVWGSVV